MSIDHPVSQSAGAAAHGSADGSTDLRHLHPDHIQVGDTAVFAGHWAWEDRGPDQEQRIPVGFVGILIDRWNGWAVFRCNREVAAGIVAEQNRLRTVERHRLRKAGLSDDALAAALDEAYPPMSWDDDEIVVDQQAVHGEDGISRIAPDKHGQYVVNGWSWTWTVVNPADCDRIIGRPPAADEQPALTMLPHSGLRVPHTRLAVTAIALPHVGPADALTAVLRLDDTLVGVADTDGRQPLAYHPVRGSRFGRTQVAMLAAHCRRRGLPVTVDELLRCLVQEYDLTVQAHHAAGRGDTLVRLTDSDGRVLVIDSVPAPADAHARLTLAKAFVEADAPADGIVWEILIGRGWAFLSRAHGR